VGAIGLPIADEVMMAERNDHLPRDRVMQFRHLRAFTWEM